ncbi:MAG: ATP-binding protein [Phycisphaerae bacterium]
MLEKKNGITGKVAINRFISNRFFRAALAPLFVIEIALIVLYFSINAYNDNQTKGTLQTISKSHLQEIATDQADKISEQLSSVTSLGHVLQEETERFFKTPESFPVPVEPSVFDFASNGVYYKLNNNGGSSLFYAALFPIGDEEKKKAKESEALDHIYRHLYESNKNIVAIYFNTFDSMNRYYPFIEDCYKQFPRDMNIPEYNFYYLADANHNPDRKVVWTEAYLDPAGKGWMMSCIVPVYKGDFLEGVAGIDITIDKFINNIIRLKLPWDAKAFLVDSRGTIMAMPTEVERVFGLTELHKYVYAGQVQQDTFKPEEFNLLASKIPGMAQTVSSLMKKQNNVEDVVINSAPYFLSQATVAETDWKLFVLADKNKILAPALRLEKNSQRIGFMAIGVMILFYWLYFVYLFRNTGRMSAQLAKPIVAIVEASSRLARGDYNTQLADCGVEELDVLSSSFETMAQELQHLYADLESRVDERTAQLAATNDELKNFVYIASHDLREPLRKISAFGNMVQKSLAGKITGDDAENIGFMIDGANRMTQMIEGLLAYSRVSAKAQSAETVNLNDIVKQLRELELSVLLEEKHTTIDIPQPLPEVDIDPVQIRQLMQNLIANGMKYQAKGNVPQITLTSKPAADGMVRIEITDNGIGIKPEFQQAIFIMFKRLHSKNEYEGTGIGLAVCKKIVERHGGQIGVESEPDKGSTFWFTLPVAKKPAVLASAATR